MRILLSGKPNSDDQEHTWCYDAFVSQLSLRPSSPRSLAAEWQRHREDAKYFTLNRVWKTALIFEKWMPFATAVIRINVSKCMWKTSLKGGQTVLEQRDAV